MDGDLSETDGENDDEKMLEKNGVLYPHKSWFFIFNSTIKGNQMFSDLIRTYDTIRLCDP